MLPRVTTVADLSTPALVVDTTALAHNLDTMSAALPGARLRPHVKAHKCTALAHEQARPRSRRTSPRATPSEIVGMARAGLGDDLLLANETVDPNGCAPWPTAGRRVTVAVDSDATVDAAAANGIREVLVDVNVCLPRCGCPPEDAPAARRPRARARASTSAASWATRVTRSDRRPRRTRGQDRDRRWKRLARVADAVGGDIVSAGGTGTYDINTAATEIQAGSYALMDTATTASSVCRSRARSRSSRP